MLEYINLVPHTNSILFSSLLVALLCGVTLPQGFNYLRQHNFQLNIFLAPIFFSFIFYLKKQNLNLSLSLLYSRVSASHRPHASPPSLIGKLSLSLFLSHWSPLLMSKSFISLFNCLFVHSHSLLTSPCFFSACSDFGVIVLCFYSNQIWMRIKIFFPLNKMYQLKFQ